MAAAQVQTATTFTTPSSPLPMSGLASFLNNVLSCLGMLIQTLTGVSFNSGNTDYQIVISLPAGFTRYFINTVCISGASGTLTTATAGLFTATGGGGVTIAANQAVTVSTASNDTVNNMQSLTLTGTATTAFSDTALYFRIGTAEGSAQTASVTVRYTPLP